MRGRNLACGALASLLFIGTAQAQQPFYGPSSQIERLPPVVVEAQWPGGGPVLPATWTEGPPVQAVRPLPEVPLLDGKVPCTDCPCPCCHCAPCECPCPPAACLPCPRINLVNPCWQLLVGGNVTLDVLFNSARPVAPGTPFFLL